jgi:hypothetical protein
MFHVANENSIIIEIVPSQQRDLFLAPCREDRERDNLLHRYGRGAMLSDAPKMLHQPIELIEGRAAGSLGRLLD